MAEDTASGSLMSPTSTSVAAITGDLRRIHARQSRQSRLSWRFIVVSLALIFLPIVGTLLYAYKARVDVTLAQTERMAEQIAERAQFMFLGGEAALADTVFDARNGCTEDLVSAMRDSASSHFTIRSIGLASEDTQILCTMWGLFDTPFAVRPEPELLQSPDGLIWFTVPMEGFPTPGASIVMAHQLRSNDWLYVLLQPELIVEPNDLRTLSGAIHVDLKVGDRLLTSWGAHRPAEESALVSAAAVGLYDTTVIVSVPLSVAVQQWNNEVVTSVTVGLVIAVGMMGAALMLLRRRERQLERATLDRELEAAAEVQQLLQPPKPPPGFPVDAVNVPLGHVSGDFYSFERVENGLVTFALGDVSGKGLDAALRMAASLALFRHLCKTERHPGAILSMMNDALVETARQGWFVTCVVGFVDEEAGIVRFANAGHVPPVLVQPDGRHRRFPAGQMPLGILPDLDYPCEEVALDGGSFFVMTDGLAECRNEARQDVGDDAVLALCLKHTGGPAVGQPEAVVAEVLRRRWTTRDDLTVLVASLGAEYSVTTRR